MNFFSRLKEGLNKTRENLTRRVGELLAGSSRLDDDFFDELEEILLTADVGARTSMELVERLRREVRDRKITDPAAVGSLLQEEVARMLGEEVPRLVWAPEPPTVILVVGVNGAGKTTTIGKLACRFAREGKRVILAAADTFRAAAGEQLAVWAERAGAGLIRHQAGADPAAVVYAAIQSARNRRADVVLVDTAGRLQTKTNLMEELKKIRRVMERELPGSPHEVLLVLDATTGQNALSQARLFSEAVGVTGIALTKLDGTAKGGVILGIAAEMGIPVKLVGLGEGPDDLKEFQPRDFAAALFSGLAGEKEE
ncbi:signal recognition particle-docking protein FtsY [Neomoorella thermoacetica]|uniref:Signal recognition particle receptor FtsY n=1 Tax=Moorella thermoacetica (strain ATCC 39073 / JCM 9320) TaxID=264732 RepID=Q2RJW2_MOOTA|nr:signal recognition particle-docking protein FtsY [Moorella thermoacetica]AKX96363.1 signal recognition particle receptor FtsY [Moorella thermoacetica]OIQ54924.1 signal recognition particle receptor FtsY [Moorella thermoacetica]OIQ55822.1 signal recognition particle receptor FtsY [Moorella thermoacetica]QDA00177.1 Signal recognition particle receptor FtsY [Moorella thermoacetica]TYL06780.1 Signal recognition particle receptor FtsY [Moorella thermoacetica]